MSNNNGSLILEKLKPFNNDLCVFISSENLNVERSFLNKKVIPYQEPALQSCSRELRGNALAYQIAVFHTCCGIMQLDHVIIQVTLGNISFENVITSKSRYLLNKSVHARVPNKTRCANHSWQVLPLKRAAQIEFARLQSTLQFILCPDHLVLFSCLGGQHAKDMGYWRKVRSSSKIVQRLRERLEHFPKVCEDNGGLPSFDQIK